VEVDRDRSADFVEAMRFRPKRSIWHNYTENWHFKMPAMSLFSFNNINDENP
jgi:hypothetical protein